MDNAAFQRLMEQSGELTPEQFKQFVRVYADNSGQDAGRIWANAVYSTFEQHLAALGVNKVCPYCGKSEIVQNGTNTAGIHRLLCLSCKRTFTRFTGTLLEKSRFPWEVWVEVLRMTLNDDSLETMQTVLEQDFGCKGIYIKTVFQMRLKLVHANPVMATVPPSWGPWGQSLRPS